VVETYDAIILGAGHNGLILQAYLGMAGLKTLTVERKAIAGGGLSTLEDPRHPGFLHNTHAFFQRAITAMPWYADLELESRGAHYIEPELNVALLTGDGRALEWWTDIERTIRKISQLAEIEQSFDAMRTDVAAASKEVSLLSETARDSAARIDATLAAFRAAVDAGGGSPAQGAAGGDQVVDQQRRGAAHVAGEERPAHPAGAAPLLGEGEADRQA